MTASGGSERTVDQGRIWEHFQNRASESFAWARPRLEYLARQITRYSGGMSPKVLNIGVGDGYLEALARSRGWSIHALDPDEATIRRLREQGIDGHVGVIERVPLADAEFDFVTVSEVLEHLTSEQAAAGLREIARILKPGGWLLGTVPYRERLADNETICPRCSLVFHRWGHQRSFSPDDLRAELRRYFDVRALRCRGFATLRGRPLLGKAKGLIRLVMARCGAMVASPTLYFAARKR